MKCFIKKKSKKKIEKKKNLLEKEEKLLEGRSMIKKKLLTPNEWSRPVREINNIKAIVIHWIADPKGTPTTVYKWFEDRKKGKTGYGSAHYCIGVDGEVLQYIPDDEMAYHVGSKTYTKEALKKLGTYPNNCTIGIELCHMNWEGEFSDKTLKEAKKLTTLLLKEYDLKETDIMTHKEVVGWKDCPRWFVDHPESEKEFKRDVKKLLDSNFVGSVNAKSLNIRDKPNGNKVGSLSYGKAVDIIGIKNGWFKIRNGYDIGYCYSKYIDII